MFNKKVKYTYKGMNRDITKSKHPYELYYEGRNIKVTFNDSQSLGSLTNEKGNELMIKIPSITIDTVNKDIVYNFIKIRYKNIEIDNINITGDQVIIGHTNTRDTIIIASTNDIGADCIWEISNLNGIYNIKLLYIRNLGFSKNNPIQLIYNYETKNIQKIYWVDGKNQLRFLNIKHSIVNEDNEDLIDVPSTTINIVGEYNINQPVVNTITHGGEHTSGMIQYSYNLYRLGGAQSTISPLSELISLDYGDTLNGGDINEVVGASPLVEINDLDDNYTHIKLYAIKYTSYNTIPTVSLILDERISSYTSFKYFDNGSKISSLSLAEFIFLGSNLVIPKNIVSKDNRLFMSNIKDKTFNLDIDMRAFSFNNNFKCKLWEKRLSVDANGMPHAYTLLPNDYVIDKTHDSINYNYEFYKYQKDGVTFGGEGKYIKYELLQNANIKSHTDRVFKDLEIYRISIEFYNSYGQKSLPIWIADFRTLEGNLNKLYNKLKIELKPDFYTYINTLTDPLLKPVGYKILRADRTLNDQTVITQGVLTGMMCQTTKNVGEFDFWKIKDNRKTESDNINKIPSYFTRGALNEGVISKSDHLSQMNEGGKEIYTSTPSDGKRQHTWQYTKMMQLYSPELLFSNVGLITDNIRLRIKGVYQDKVSNIWYKQLNLPSLSFINDEKKTNFFNYNTSGDGIVDMKGVIGPSDDSDDNISTNMVYKRFHHTYTSYLNINSTWEIYGKPEITERGQTSTSYFNDDKFKYINTLDNFLSDKYDRQGGGGSSPSDEVEIRSLNTYNSKCITLVEGSATQELKFRKSLEEFYNAPTRGILIGELYYDLPYIYNSNIYGGNSYESKTRNTYIQIGNYYKLDQNVVVIDSPGDTYVQNFKFGRLIPTDTKKLNSTVLQLSESLEYITETTINLKNRNDFSTKSWDAKFQPTYEEYNKYNRVYSQQPTLITNKAKSFKLKKNDTYDVRVIASKLKIPGQSIDSWTDFLENEIIDLDGKYGSINSLINFNDNIYVIQDRGIAYLSINPRVQIQGNDDISIELGKGSILNDYRYITTKSGSINKWSVSISPTGFYYFDILNRSIFKSNGREIVNISDKTGFHNFLLDNTNIEDLSIDNPILRKGISTGYDLLNDDMYITLLQSKNNITLNYNENINNMESFHDYFPSTYINKDSKLITTNPVNNSLYEHGKGKYQTFYGNKYSSYIILQINPESDLDCVFNNIEYKSEIYLNDIDKPQNTLTHISAWNEYQKTNRIPLILGRDKNLRRKFRNWQAQIPREAGTRNRIRNPWIFLKLELDTTDNLKMILHDVIIHYTA